MAELTEISMANELLTVLEGEKEDSKLFKSLTRKWTEIREQPKKQYQAIQQAIKQLIECEDDDIQASVGSGDMEEVAHKLERQISEKVNQLEQTVKDCEEKKIKLEECQSRQQTLKSERNGIKTDVNISLPKARYDVNLYSHISNIRWRYDCKDNEVVGYMCDRNNVKPFSFDRNQVSDFFIVNSLWDLMEEDW